MGIASSGQGVANSGISVNLGNLDNLDGLEAWVHIRTVPFDLVIVELEDQEVDLPGANGEPLEIDSFGAAYIAVGLTGFAVSW